MSDGSRRVLFTAASGIGHIHPLLPLATALVSQGHEVRFATASDMVDAVQQVGIPAVIAGLTRHERGIEFGRSWGAHAEALPPAARPDFMFPRIFGATAMPPMLDDLRALAAQWAPDLIVHDAAELAAPLLAAELGVPRAAHSFGSTFPLDRIQDAGAVTAELWAAAGLEQPPYAGLFSDIYIDIRPPSLAGAAPPEAPVLIERPTAYDAVGGALPPMVTAPSDRPLVYLTLGTVFTDPEVLRDGVAALADLPVRLLVTVGPAGDPDAVGPVPGNVHVATYVPQTLLFEHCAVVVSHAGSGTFLGALAQGLPQLCLPQGADQFINASDGARSGAALCLAPDEVTPADVRSAVVRLLEEPSYRGAAERLAGEIAAMPSPEDVAERLMRQVDLARAR